MDLHKTIAVLEALASGCSPATGEVIPDESVLNERNVIRALQIAIDHLKVISENPSGVDIDEKDIETAVQLFLEHQLSPTYSRLVGFFLATRVFKNESITSNELYGKYKDIYQKGQLLDFFATYLSDNGYSRHGKRTDRANKDKPWAEIDFFDKETFNNLSEEAVKQLKEKINELGITKTDNLADYIQQARINYPRAYEPWTDIEKDLLSEALKYTNDLELLTEYFQRGKGAVISYGKQLIYQNQGQKGCGNEQL